MNISCGIVGLPNVGKSTLFNALLKKQAALAANYPFATIEPNTGIVPVPDERLEKLAELTKEEEKMSQLPPIKPATVEFVDIAGLVKGAAEGAGLGNKFLSHIREVNVIAHVVRAFEDPDVIREGSVGPKEDYETIQAELILADIQTLGKVAENRKIEPAKKSAVEKLLKDLDQGKRAYSVQLTEEEREAIKELFLLTNKPEVIVLNVDEDSLDKSDEIIERYQQIFSSVIPAKAGIHGSRIKPGMTNGGAGDHINMIVICAKIESELAALSEEEQKEYLADLGLEKSGLERLIQKAYQELGLISFLTAGEKEVRAWTIKKQTDAPNAAGAIHTDFTKKFIKAEVISFEDYVGTGGCKKAKELGKARLEGRDYIVQDGDVIEFKIGA
ncbi:MAG: redox-regulated ATPase YchF [Patescibacteria group bacterium]